MKEDIKTEFEEKIEREVEKQLESSIDLELDATMWFPRMLYKIKNELVGGPTQLEEEKTRQLAAFKKWQSIKPAKGMKDSNSTLLGKLKWVLMQPFADLIGEIIMFAIKLKVKEYAYDINNPQPQQGRFALIDRETGEEMM